MKKLAPLRYVLSIEVDSSPIACHNANMSTRSFTVPDSLMTKLDTSIELHAKFPTSDGVLLKHPTLIQLVGCLVYLTVTHSDISHMVHVVSQFFCVPRSTHWAALLRIFLYVCGTLFQCLLSSSASS